MVAEGLSYEDPTRFAETPRRGQSLPKALDVSEVERLVETPDATTSLGRRDRALLETLYATGARVTEVADLDMADVDLETRTALVTGKGSKQRMVPLGSAAIAAIERYLPDRLELRVSGADSGRFFSMLGGGALTRQGIYGIVPIPRRSRRHRAFSNISACPTTLGRDPYGRGWSRSAHGPGDPGSR